MAPDKQAAYDTLWEALVRIATLMSPVAPYLSDWMYRELTRSASFPGKQDSVHLADWPVVNAAAIHSLLEARMQLAQEVCSLGHSIRKKHKVKARQPLQRLLVPVLDDSQRSNLEAIAELVAAELNVKEVKAVTDSEAHIVRRIKPDFKALGPRLGADLKHVQAALNELGQAEIRQLEQAGQLELTVNGKPFILQRAEAEILIDDIPGWAAATANGVSVALDLTLTDDLRNEGLARDLVNRLQNLRKDLGLEVTDRIRVSLQQVPEWAGALNQFQPYICAEILAEDFRIVPEVNNGQALEVDGTHTQVLIERIAPR
jgi:isoleucyl-tRNA synthetase